MASPLNFFGLATAGRWTFFIAKPQREWLGRSPDTFAQLLTINVIVGENAQCRAIEVLVLIRPQRPRKSDETCQAEHERHRHEVNQDIHCTHSN
jgi:hypothetical protein